MKFIYVFAALLAAIPSFGQTLRPVSYNAGNNQIWPTNISAQVQNFAIYSTNLTITVGPGYVSGGPGPGQSAGFVPDLLPGGSVSVNNNEIGLVYVATFSPASAGTAPYQGGAGNLPLAGTVYFASLTASQTVPVNATVIAAYQSSGGSVTQLVPVNGNNSIRRNALVFTDSSQLAGADIYNSVAVVTGGSNPGIYKGVSSDPGLGQLFVASPGAGLLSGAGWTRVTTESVPAANKAVAFDANSRMVASLATLQDQNGLVTTVDTMAQLVAYPVTGVRTVYLRGYNTPGDGGGGAFSLTNTAVGTNIGTLVSSTADATKSWYRHLPKAGVVSVKMFGAYGNFSASISNDDAPAFAAAANWLDPLVDANSQVPIVEVPSGNYLFKTTANTSYKFEMRGESSTHQNGRFTQASTLWQSTSSTGAMFNCTLQPVFKNVNFQGRDEGLQVPNYGTIGTVSDATHFTVLTTNYVPVNFTKAAMPVDSLCSFYTTNGTFYGVGALTNTTSGTNIVLDSGGVWYATLGGSKLTPGMKVVFPQYVSYTDAYSLTHSGLANTTLGYPAVFLGPISWYAEFDHCAFDNFAIAIATRAHEMWVRNCRFSHNGIAGVYADAAYDGTILNCLFDGSRYLTTNSAMEYSSPNILVPAPTDLPDTMNYYRYGHSGIGGNLGRFDIKQSIINQCVFDLDISSTSFNIAAMLGDMTVDNQSASAIRLTGFCLASAGNITMLGGPQVGDNLWPAILLAGNSSIDVVGLDIDNSETGSSTNRYTYLVDASLDSPRAQPSILRPKFHANMTNTFVNPNTLSNPSGTPAMAALTMGAYIGAPNQIAPANNASLYVDTVNPGATNFLVNTTSFGGTVNVPTLVGGSASITTASITTDNVTSIYGGSAIITNTATANLLSGGVTIPGWLLHTQQKLSAITTGTTGGRLDLWGDGGNNGSIVLGTVLGTMASPSFLTSGYNLGTIGFSSWNSSFDSQGANILAQTTQTWSSSARGTKMIFSTVPNNSTTLTAALTLDQDQSATVVGVIKASGGLTIGSTGVKISNSRTVNTSAMTAGSIAVSDSAITANSRIWPTQLAPAGTPGALFVASKIASTGYTITSTSALDTSTLAIKIEEP